MRISDWSSDVCSSDLGDKARRTALDVVRHRRGAGGDGSCDRKGWASRAVRHSPCGSCDEYKAFPVASRGSCDRRRSGTADLALVQARRSVVEGKSVSVRVELGGRRTIKQKRYYI